MLRVEGSKQLWGRATSATVGKAHSRIVATAKASQPPHLPPPCLPCRRLAAEALQTEFPPARMVAAYDKQWARLQAVDPGGTAACRMAKRERRFYEEQVG